MSAPNGLATPPGAPSNSPTFPLFMTASATATRTAADAPPRRYTRTAMLLLSVLGLLWRATHRPPALPPAIENAMPGWQKLAHHATHGLLYTLFFAVPLIGWAYSSAAGFPIVFLGLWQLPDFVPVSKELAEAIKPWHQYTAFAMAGLVLLHIAGALKHQIVDRDGLIARMLPGR